MCTCTQIIGIAQIWIPPGMPGSLCPSKWKGHSTMCTCTQLIGIAQIWIPPWMPVSLCPSKWKGHSRMCTCTQIIGIAQISIPPRMTGCWCMSKQTESSKQNVHMYTDNWHRSDMDSTWNAWKLIPGQTNTFASRYWSDWSLRCRCFGRRAVQHENAWTPVCHELTIQELQLEGSLKKASCEMTTCPPQGYLLHTKCMDICSQDSCGKYIQIKMLVLNRLYI